MRNGRVHVSGGEKERGRFLVGEPPPGPHVEPLLLRNKMTEDYCSRPCRSYTHYRLTSIAAHKSLEKKAQTMLKLRPYHPPQNRYRVDVCMIREFS